MPSSFNAETFDLSSRIGYIEAWADVKAHLEDHDTATIRLDCDKKGQALNEMHSFNRVRAALRAQKDDGYIYDDIKLTLIEIEGTWALRFVERENVKFKIQ